MKIQQIHHKKNELFEVEFFTDKECTKLIKDYLPYAENAKISEMSNFYIEIEKGDITPLTALLRLSHNVNDYFYIPYIPKYQLFNLLNCTGKIKTLDDITPNLSKYIPEDNAVLFLSEEDCNKYYFTGLLNLVLNDTRFDVKILKQDFDDYIQQKFGTTMEELDADEMESGATIEDAELKKTMKLTIFLPHGTQSELQKAEEVAKELKEKYGLEEVNVFVLHWFGSEYQVNVFVLHWFGSKYQENGFEIKYLCKDSGVLSNFNKLITTNSTGILPVQNEERLQVIDCKEIFEEYLKENN